MFEIKFWAKHGMNDMELVIDEYNQQGRDDMDKDYFIELVFK